MIYELDLLTNATVVDDAIRFVTEKAAAAIANAEPKTDPRVVIEEEKQQQEQEEDNTTTEPQQKSDITINQVF